MVFPNVLHRQRCVGEISEKDDVWGKNGSQLKNRRESESVSIKGKFLCRERGEGKGRRRQHKSK